MAAVAVAALEDRKIEVMTVPQAVAVVEEVQDYLLVNLVLVVMMEMEDFLKEIVVQMEPLMGMVRS